MQPNEKTNEKINQQLSTQPKKTWEDPAMTRLDINSGKYKWPWETTSGSIQAGPGGSDLTYWNQLG